MTDKSHFFCKRLVYSKYLLYLCSVKGKTKLLCLHYLHYLVSALLFYSNDHEPIHVHVIKDEHEAKFGVDPVQLVENNGLKASEQRLAESVIEENKEIIINRWNEYLKK